MNESYDYLAPDLEMLAEAAAAIVTAKCQCSRLGLECVLHHNSGTTRSALGEAMGRMQAMADMLMSEGVVRPGDMHRGRQVQYSEIDKSYLRSEGRAGAG